MNIERIRFEEAPLSAGVRTWLLEIPVSGHPASVWQGLWTLDSPKRAGNPYLEYGINNAESELFHLLRAIAWAAGQGLNMVGSPAYYRDDAAEALGIPPHEARLVSWEYRVEEAEARFEDADKGYEEARACVPTRPKPSSWQAANAKRAGLFSLRQFSDLSALDLAVAGDASSEITLYSLPGQEIDKLAAVLNGVQRPVMSDVLAVADTFVDISQIRDLYAYGASRLIVRSRSDLSPMLQELASRGRRSWATYCEVAPHLSNWDDWHGAIADLTSPVLSL